MELLRNLVKEQGIVDIITDYKTEMEFYEHNKKFKEYLNKIQIKLLNEDGHQIDLNGNEFQFDLVFYSKK